MKRAQWILLVSGLLLSALGCGDPDATVVYPEDEPAIESDTAGVPDKLVEMAKNDHIALLEACRNHYKEMDVKSYTCTFVKQERIDGKVRPEQKMDVKFMRDPFSVAMDWTQNPPRGEALVYVQGKYKNDDGQSQMVVKPTGSAAQFFTGGSVLRVPTSPEVMKETLRPVTQFGFANAMEDLLKVYRKAEKNGDLKQSYTGLKRVDGRKCLVLERILPEKREGYPAKKTLICIDAEWMVPTRISAYNWSDEFVSRYTYTNVKFNAGLTANDFTPEANGIKAP